MRVQKQSETHNKIVKEQEYLFTKENGKKVYKSRTISKATGTWIYYDLKGNMISEIKYRNGKNKLKLYF